MGLGSNDFCDRRSHCQIVGHYKTDIISSMSDQRSGSVWLLMVDVFEHLTFMIDVKYCILDPPFTYVC
jgi:hypothetical protein